MSLTCWSRSVSVVATFIIATAACSSEPFAPVPDRFEAMYVATLLKGEPLPVKAAFADSEITLIADTLQFASNGRVLRTTVTRVIDETWTPPEGVVNVARFEFHYTVRNRRLELMAFCVEIYDCSPITGEINTDYVFLSSSPLNIPRDDMVYSRVTALVD